MSGDWRTIHETPSEHGGVVSEPGYDQYERPALETSVRSSEAMALSPLAARSSALATTDCSSGEVMDEVSKKMPSTARLLEASAWTTCISSG